MLIFVVGVGFWFVKGVRENKVERVSEKIQEVNLEPLPIKNYIQSCLHEVVTPGIYLLANKGGYIYFYNKTLNTEYQQIAYHLELNKNVAPRKEFMERELSRFVRNSLSLCLSKNENLDFSEIEFGKLDVISKIFDTNVLVKINYPISINYKDSKIKLDDFSETIPIRLGHIIDIKDKIINKLTDKSEIDPEFLSQFDVEVNILPYDKNNIMYSIYDNTSSVKNSLFYFNFAEKISGNIPPKLEFIPDFIVTEGKLFVYDVNATDQNEDILTYYSNSKLAKIDPVTGLLSFTPTNVGDFDTEICVKDIYLAKDCETVKFMVKNE